MSFILDALQKDQVEQQPQPTPAGMLPPTRPSPAKRWGLWLIGAALVINAGVLAWFLLAQQGAQTNEPKVATSLPGAQRELAVAPAPSTAPRTAPSQPRQEPVLPKRTPVRTPTRTPAVAATRPAPRPQAQPAPQATPKATSGGGRVLSPEQAAQMGIGGSLLDDDGLASNTPAAEPRASSAAPATSTQPSSNAIRVDQLPPAARDSFPTLEFSTHIFADDPSMRAVVVNDKRLTEGEQLGELVLRAVTEEGVIFGYRSHRVAVSVVELWAE